MPSSCDPNESPRIAAGPSGHSATNRRHDRLHRGRPQVRILLGPSGMREGEVVGLVGGGDELAVRGVQGTVRPLAADVAADHVRTAHGMTTIFKPVPARIVSNASAIFSSGQRCVTTFASSSCLRSR